MVDSSTLAAAGRVVVVEGASYDSKHRKSNVILGSTDGPALIHGLARSLLSRTAERADWMEWPTLTVVFLDKREVVSAIPVLSRGEWVRDPLDGDSQLTDPSALVGLLRSIGVRLGPE